MMDPHMHRWYRELERLKAEAKEAPVIMAAAEESRDAPNNGPCIFDDVIVSGREDNLYAGLGVGHLPLYHLHTADGSLITASGEDLQVIKGGRVEALHAYVKRAMVVTHQINRLMDADFLDPLDLLERGTESVVEAFEALVDLA